jgi:hypothetical protein
MERTMSGQKIIDGLNDAIAGNFSTREFKVVRGEATLDQMKAKASQIQRDLDMIIEGIDPKEIGGPVNWADLSCVDVSVSLMDGSWSATVEEASPDASELAAYLNIELQRLGHDVWVRCEW